MKRSIFLLSGLFALMFLWINQNLWAEPVDSLTVKKVAANFFAGNSSSLRSAKDDLPEVKIVQIRKSEESQQPYYYVLNNESSGGWVILSGDSRVKPVIAYSDDSNFVAGGSPTYEWWMNGMVEEIKCILNVPQLKSQSFSEAESQWSELLAGPVVKRKNALKSAQSTTSYTPGTYLLPCTWNQTGAYAQFTPNNWPTGCVATATGQIMYYWGQQNNITALQGAGYFEYYDAGSGFPGVKRSVDYSTRVYDLKDMPATAGNAAVSQLLADIGVGLRMQYTSSGSGSLNMQVPSVLCSYFGFQPAQYIDRAEIPKVTNEDVIFLQNAIKNEINNGRPVIYGGQGSPGGHSFVIDGYNTGTLFHFNWGWGNSSYNGFYTLTLMDTDTPPTPTAVDFWESQNAVIGIQPYDSEESLGYEITDVKFYTQNGSCNVYNQFIPSNDGSYNYYASCTIINHTSSAIMVPLSFALFCTVETDKGEKAEVASMVFIGDISVSANSSFSGVMPLTVNESLFASLSSGNFHIDFGIQVNDANGGSYVNIGRNQRVIVNPQIVVSEPSFACGDSILYVYKGGKGDQTGLSWDNAMAELSDALQYAQDNKNYGVVGVPITQIWVAGGTYAPQAIAGNGTTDNDKAFVLVDNVKVYGGFSGDETQLSDRDWNANVTTLSGNENAYHVVISAGDAGNACLDGFVIEGGNAQGTGSVTVNGFAVSQNDGGGIYFASSSPYVTNVIFTENEAENGGGMYIQDSSPVLTGLLLSNNNATVNGGAIFNTGSSSPVLTNLTICDNTASDGGGIYNETSSQIRNTIIWRNKSGETANNVTNNSSAPSYLKSLVEGGGGDILDINDPDFDTDYTLLSSSSVIGKGTSSVYDAGAIPDISFVTKDLAGNPRINTGSNNAKLRLSSGVGTVDLGAYQFVSTIVTSVESPMMQEAIALYPNPVHNVLYIQSESSIEKVTVLDITGRNIQQINVSGQHVDVSSLDKGVYLIKIITDRGESIRKVVKE
ncbi:MAG: C10 family peptidase [Candidatus Azobacteroides sp.]|nr:C10 family peptidase [Candidatus Azobacteroides sp.]